MIQDYEAFAVKIISLALKTACPPLCPSYAEQFCNIEAMRIQYNFINSSVYRNVYLPIILYAKYNNDTQSFTQLFHGKSYLWWLDNKTVKYQVSAVNNWELISAINKPVRWGIWTESIQPWSNYDYIGRFYVDKVSISGSAWSLITLAGCRKYWRVGLLRALQTPHPP